MVLLTKIEGKTKRQVQAILNEYKAQGLTISDDVKTTRLLDSVGGVYWLYQDGMTVVADDVAPEEPVNPAPEVKPEQPSAKPETPKVEVLDKKSNFFWENKLWITAGLVAVVVVLILCV